LAKDLYSVVFFEPHNTFLRSFIIFMLYKACTFNKTVVALLTTTAQTPAVLDGF